jgi:hypothetical protein
LVAHSAHRRELPAPRPATLDFKYQRPTEEGADQHEAGKEAQAGKGKFDGNGLYNIGSNQHLETKEQRFADVNLVSIVFPSLRSSMHVEIRRPDDADDNDEDTENLDAVADETDAVAGRHLEGGLVGIIDGRLPMAGQYR